LCLGYNCGNICCHSNKDGGSVSAGDLVISKSEVTEKAKFYPYNADGTRMEILAVRAGDGSIRTAFNTCQVCNGSPRAYFKQQGEFWFARTAETASVWIWLSRKGAAATRCRLQRMKNGRWHKHHYFERFSMQNKICFLQTGKQGNRCFD